MYTLRSVYMFFVLRKINILLNYSYYWNREYIPSFVIIKAEVKGYENNAGPEDREASYVITLNGSTGA